MEFLLSYVSPSEVAKAPQLQVKGGFSLDLHNLRTAFHRGITSSFIIILYDMTKLNDEPSDRRFHRPVSNPTRHQSYTARFIPTVEPWIVIPARDNIDDLVEIRM